jgi:hypothetical protein
MLPSWPVRNPAVPRPKGYGLEGCHGPTPSSFRIVELIYDVDRCSIEQLLPQGIKPSAVSLSSPNLLTLYPTGLHLYDSSLST